MRALGAIALTTYREAIRNKTLYVLALYVVLLLFSGGPLTQLSFHQEKRVFLDSVAALLDLFSAFVAMGIGVNLVYKELQNKTVYLIVTKPVSRGAFLLGKILGQWLVMGVLIAVMVLFAMAGAAMVGVGGYEAILKQGMLALFQAYLISSLALLFSSFTTPMLTGAFTLGTFVIGRFVPDMLSILRVKYEPTFARTVTEWLVDLVPQFHLYAVSGHEVEGHYVSIAADFVSWEYVLLASLYALLYGSVIVALAVWAFRRRDLT